MRVKRLDSERLDVILTVSDDRRSLSWSRAPVAPRSGCIWVRVRLYTYIYIYIYIYKNACICIKVQRGKQSRKHVCRRAGMCAYSVHTVKETYWTYKLQIRQMCVRNPIGLTTYCHRNHL